MKNVRLFPWNRASLGALELSKATGVLRLKEEGSRFIHGPRKTIVNWGSSRYPSEESKNSLWINKPESVALLANKLKFFETFDTGFCVPWSTSKDKAVEWLSEGRTVFARTTLTGHSGEGIVIMEPGDPEKWVNAPLFTLYVPKKMEFRVHVCRGETFLVQKKVLRKDANKENQSFKIRNHSNGFIFQRNDVVVPEKVNSVVSEFNRSQNGRLDFYALDIIYNEKTDSAYVLEANSAPGLTNSTVQDYKTMIEKVVN